MKKSNLRLAMAYYTGLSTLLLLFLMDVGESTAIFVKDLSYHAFMGFFLVWMLISVILTVMRAWDIRDTKFFLLVGLYFMLLFGMVVLIYMVTYLVKSAMPVTPVNTFVITNALLLSPFVVFLDAIYANYLNERAKLQM